ncbi:MAG TPA: inositol monophosphatase family protein [Ktedonobacteraceae bacterium]|nr:inositol monophosphatase family protein [Ktedonobacteraceae bacterium]
MLELLEQLFRHVRAYLHSERFNRNQVYFSSSQHTIMQFDREAEDIIISGLVESGYGFEVITEERPVFTTSTPPQYRIIVDPIDGSTNVSRGIMTAAVSLAVLPMDTPIVAEQVQWALVGELFSGTVYQAQHGGGAFCNGRRCQVSEIQGLDECIVGMNLDGRDLYTQLKLLTQHPAIGKIRRTGSSAMDLVYVANGAYDAYIDIGGIITAESFLAASSIICEAGGIISDRAGKPLRAVTNLTEGFSLIAAGTRDLHQQLVSRINS